MTPDPNYDTPKRFRVPDEEWDAFEKATREMHPKGRSPRARVLREFMRWYMRRPGAELPDRPAANWWSTPGATPASEKS